MTPVHAEFTLTGEDYEQYLRYFYRHTQPGRRQLRRLYALGIAAFLYFVWREADHPRFGLDHPAYFAAYMILSGALLGGGYWFAITRLWPSLARVAAYRSPRRGMFSPTRVTLHPTEMTLETSQGSGRLSWDGVREWAETEEALYLFTGGINAVILPKRAFASGSDIQAALDILAQYHAQESGPDSSE